MRSSFKTLPLIAALGLSACATTPGPSVPFKQTASLQSARAALQACGPSAKTSGKNNVVGSYVAGFLLGGLVVGPIIVAVNESDIRKHGEIQGADRCLEKQGFVRRDLTQDEVRFLNTNRGASRDRVLEHFIRGGTVDNYS